MPNKMDKNLVGYTKMLHQSGAPFNLPHNRITFKYYFLDLLDNLINKQLLQQLKATTYTRLLLQLWLYYACYCCLFMKALLSRN